MTFTHLGRFPASALGNHTFRLRLPRCRFTQQTHRGCKTETRIADADDDDAGDGAAISACPYHPVELGAARCEAGGAAAGGKAVQVHPIKLTMKAPGTERLKLEYDKLLSSFAFKTNMRRYRVVNGAVSAHPHPTPAGRVSYYQVTRCSLTLSNPVLKAPMVSALETII